MFNFKRLCKRLRERSGQTMTEYALLAAGIALAAAAGYNGLGNSTNSAVGAATQLIAGSTATPGSGGGGTVSSGGTNQSGSGSGGGGDGDHHHDGDHF